ncbi:Hsp20/alpha crystallin family protein [Halocalculus aciditolerans]|uniref:Molecular chaperone Hsp20 n=1 Tax=Halocalculus aciditolerans TaxID=1383812 RepID=A0A830FGR4_9EURY|nr:Hsp20/alpha crystallin family protein [Halocalculus aciditolerans]GGL51243.1 molecular chaperone Hsp20 [Halocalculus aciditolerans]
MSSLREALQNLPDGVFADLLESDDAYLLVLDLPGVTPDGVDLSVEGLTLHVSARRDKAVPEGFSYHREDRALFLDADVPLPPDATETEASASLDDGVLEVTIPKRASSGRTIPVED